MSRHRPNPEGGPAKFIKAALICIFTLEMTLLAAAFFHW